jgi:hypothetical protein
VQGGNPLTVPGKNFDSRDFASRLMERLKDKDYLDVFEAIYLGFEEARRKIEG